MDMIKLRDKKMKLRLIHNVLITVAERQDKQTIEWAAKEILRISEK